MSERYEFIDVEKAGRDECGALRYTIVKMCQWLEVSTSGYYDWLVRPASATVERREWLKVLITDLFDESDGTYGYRRMHAELGRCGQAAGLELVRQLMRELGLVACQPRPWRFSLTDADDEPAAIPDLVDRDFAAERPGAKMVGDITYISTWEGWVYLATVIDCCTKEVVGWAMDDNYKTPLIVEAIQMAAKNHTLADGAIFHSDRGSNYTSAQFGVALAERGIRQSVGRTGICYDNAMAESFFGALKNERVNRTEYPTREHARKDIARYIEFRYNTKRLHSSLGYNTPREVREMFENNQMAA